MSLGPWVPPSVSYLYLSFSVFILHSGAQTSSHGREESCQQPDSGFSIRVSDENEPWPTPSLQPCGGLGRTPDLQKLQDYKCVLFEANKLVVIWDLFSACSNRKCPG